jgi:hypothetical protein
MRLLRIGICSILAERAAASFWQVVANEKAFPHHRTFGGRS